MNRRWQLLLVCAVAYLGELACSEEPVVAECETLCGNIEHCEYFPSPLGTGESDQANCKERCELSSTPSANALRECSQKVDSHDIDCDKLRGCLIQAAGVQVLGRADVKLTVSVDQASGCAMAGAAGAGTQPIPPGVSVGGQASWCEATGVAVVVPFVETLQQRFFGELSDCVGEPHGDFVVRSVPKGHLEKVGVELRGTLPNDPTSGTSFCFVAATGSASRIDTSQTSTIAVTTPSEDAFACGIATSQLELCPAQ